MMIVWQLGVKIIRTILCCIVNNVSYAHRCIHKYEYLSLGLGFVLLCFCLGLMQCITIL